MKALLLICVTAALVRPTGAAWASTGALAGPFPESEIGAIWGSALEAAREMPGVVGAAVEAPPAARRTAVDALIEQLRLTPSVSYANRLVDALSEVANAQEAERPRIVAVFLRQMTLTPSIRYANHLVGALEALAIAHAAERPGIVAVFIQQMKMTLSIGYANRLAEALGRIASKERP